MYRGRSLPNVRQYNFCSPQGGSSNGCYFCRLSWTDFCAPLFSHTHICIGISLSSPVLQRCHPACGPSKISIFPVQLTTRRIGNLTRLMFTLLYVMTTHAIVISYWRRFVNIRDKASQLLTICVWSMYHDMPQYNMVHGRDCHNTDDRSSSWDCQNTGIVVGEFAAELRHYNYPRKVIATIC